MDFNKLFSLEGRVALVTGGQRGIGAMITEGFLDQGAKVYISGRKADQGEAAAAEFGDKCIYIQGDISTYEGCKALAAEIASREEKLDILVNNAGVAWGEEYLSFPETGWDKVMDTNVKGLFFLTQALHPQLKAAASYERPAKVINIASIDGMKVNPWETYSYQASKAAVIHLTRKMASKLVQEDIIMTGIAPGAFAVPRTWPRLPCSWPVRLATMLSAPRFRSMAVSSMPPIRTHRSNPDRLCRLTV